jgi:hypothetical protein
MGPNKSPSKVALVIGRYLVFAWIYFPEIGATIPRSLYYTEVLGTQVRHCNDHPDGWSS